MSVRQFLVESLIKPAVRSTIPGQMRAFLRHALHGRWVFSRAIRGFLRDPEDSLNPKSKTLEKLIYGWGNQGFSASEDYLTACIRLALDNTGPVLECGSGLSTLLISAICARKGNRHYVLEHSEVWSEKTERALIQNNLRSSALLRRPLRDYGEYAWYDVAPDELPNNISVVICDGPPGQTKGGRYGLLPVVGSNLAPGCVVLLDDACRLEERAIADRWVAEFGGSSRICGDDASFIEFRLAK